MSERYPAAIQAARLRWNTTVFIERDVRPHVVHFRCRVMRCATPQNTDAPPTRTPPTTSGTPKSVDTKCTTSQPRRAQQNAKNATDTARGGVGIVPPTARIPALKRLVMPKATSANIAPEIKNMAFNKNPCFSLIEIVNATSEKAATTTTLCKIATIR